MIFRPILRGTVSLDKETLVNDKKNCSKSGPCGVGEKALYFGGLYFNRVFYVTYEDITRVFKRVAMSRGGFNGRGSFISMAELVAVKKDGKEITSVFKYEEDVDKALELIKKACPGLPTVSEQGEKRIAEREKAEREFKYPEISDDQKKTVETLEKAKAYLEKRPSLSSALSSSARRRRAYEITNPAYRWFAIAMVILGILAVIWGIFSIINGAEIAIYVMIFGVAAVLLFASSQILPTAGNNKKALEKTYNAAVADMESNVKAWDGGAFPVPAYYAHPLIIDRMIEAVKLDKATDAASALECVKEDLKRVNSSVEVDKDEYNVIIRIKPMFLIKDYE